MTTKEDSLKGLVIMPTKFSQFLQGLVPRNTDIEVGLRSGLNVQGVSSGIADSAGATIASWLQGAGPNVNYIGLQNNIAGSAPVISVIGTDANPNLNIIAQGTGHVEFPGTGAIGVPVGTTAQQPVGFNGGFRYNSDTNFLEYWNAGASTWVDIINGAALADATFVTNTDETADLPNSQPLSALATGIMKVTTGTGIISSLAIPLTADLGGSGVVSPTAHGILVAEGASAFATMVLGSGQILIGSAGVDPVIAAINSGTGILVANGAGSITVSNTGVTALTGTVNQITVSASTGSVTLSIPSVFVAPGSIAATTTISGTTFKSSTLTASRIVVSDVSKNLTSLTTANSAALVTTSAGVPIMTSTMTDGQLVIGSTGATPVAATLTQGSGITITNGAGTIIIAATGGGGTVTSVSGTLNRITSTGGTTPVIDISASYVGQSSITTVGALASGSLAVGFTPVPVVIGGTGLSSTTINQILYSSANNVISGLATANGAALVTTSAGVPIMTSTMTNGQLILGSTGATPVVVTLALPASVAGLTILSGAGTLTIQQNIIDMVAGRLTLTSGTPVTTGDVTGATTIYYTPYKGTDIALYTGTASLWAYFQTGELSIAVPAAASQMYDVFVFSNSGTPTMQLVAWTSDTVRATALVYQDGVLCQSGALGKRYMGSFRTDSSNKANDSAALRNVWNYYNRVNKSLLNSTASSWSYQSATIRQSNASTSMQVNFVVGIS